MRLLVVHPGADWSTSDVHDGLVAGLEARGHEIVRYRLSGRIARAHDYLRFCWRRNKELSKPTLADAVHYAGREVVTAALWHDVDWVLIVSGMFVAPDWLVIARRAGLRVACLFTESPYDDEQQIRLAPWLDCLWVNERTSVERFRALNPESHYLMHAYDPARHAPAKADASLPAHDVVFVGTGFQERVEMLAGVDWTGIDLGLYGNWRDLGSRHRLRRHVRGDTVSNEVAAGLYRRAQIGLNLYRQSMGWGRNATRIHQAESVNPRALELAACEVFQIADYRREAEEVFGDSVLTVWPDSFDLQNKIRMALDLGPEYRQERARESARRVAGHTFASRAAQIERTLMGILAERLSAPAVQEVVGYG